MVDTQLDVVHTFMHFTVLCTLRTFPNAPVFVTETVPSSVRVVPDARHTLRESVVVLNISLSDKEFPEPLS